MSDKILDMLKSIFENCFGEVLAALIIFILILCKKLWRKLKHKDRLNMEIVVWSPKNDDVCFVISNNGKCELNIYDVNSGKKITLDTSIAEGQTPTWSPDGSKIALVSDQDGNKEIYVVNADGSNIRRITDDPAEDIYPQWSADSLKLTYFTRKNGFLVLKTVDVTEID